MTGRRFLAMCGDSCNVFLSGTTFVALVVIVIGDPNPKDNGVQQYRAPKTCPNLPSYCNIKSRVAWACENNMSACYKECKGTTCSPDQNNLANLTANEFYYNKNSNSCVKALNLTWMMALSDMKQTLIGFQINYIRHIPPKNFFHAKSTIKLIKDWKKTSPSNSQNGTVLFYFDCLKLSPATNYSFELLSLHQSSGEELSRQIGVTSLSTDCDTYPDADPKLGKWNCYISHQLEDENSTIAAYFAPAPDSFGYTHYKVALFASGSSQPIAEALNLTFKCTAYGGVLFKSVCSGEYQIKVYAYGRGCPCENCNTCGYHSLTFEVSGSRFLDQCSDRILVEVPFMGITVNSTFSSSSEMSLLEPSIRPLSAATFMQEEMEKKELDKITFAICGLISAAAILAVVIVAYVLLSRRRQGLRMVTVAAYSENKGKDVAEPSIVPKRVLLIYAQDNIHHCKVVRRLATYLQNHCYCDVKFDQWCADEISQMSALDWILHQLRSVQNIIIVNSEGGFRRYNADSRSIIFEMTVRETPLEDMFVPAVRELRNEYYRKPNTHHKIFKVAFSYTSLDYIISDIQPGRTYELMQHIEDLFLNIHGLSRHNKCGGLMAVGINRLDYSQCEEGRLLKDAIGSAVDYFQASRDWFSQSYRVKTKVEEQSENLTYDPDFSPGCDSGIEQISMESTLSSNGDRQVVEFDPPKEEDDDDDASVTSRNLALMVGKFNDEFDSKMFYPNLDLYLFSDNLK